MAKRLNARERGVVLWARRLLQEKLCIVDTETTGIDTNDEVFQVAGVLIDGAVIREQKAWMVKPKRVIHPKAQEVTGVTPAMLADKPDLAEVWSDIATWMSGRVMVAYNADFDRRLLWQSCYQRGLTFAPRRFECAMLAYGNFYGQWDDYWGSYKLVKLNFACKRQGVVLDNAKLLLALSDLEVARV